MDKYHQLADLLLQLEMTMRSVNVWEMTQPSEQDLESREPFCIDTIGFDQWLRFVMIERYKTIIEEQLPFPNHSNITPIAEMFFKQNTNISVMGILVVLADFDRFINQTTN